MTPSGSIGPHAHHEAVQVALRAERRVKAWEYFAHQSMTYGQIAKLLGVSTFTVAKDIWSVADELASQSSKLAEEWRVVQLARLDQADRAILPALYGQVKGKPVLKRVKGRFVSVEAPLDPIDVEHLKIAAHRQLVKSQELRARLLGTLAPVKVAPTDPSGTKPYQALSDEELDREIRERIALLGSARPIIEAEVVKQIEEAPSVVATES